jgi:glutamine cyclotransferase
MKKIQKPGFRTYLFLVTFIAVCLTPIVANLLYNPAESNKPNTSPIIPTPLPTPSATIPIHRPTLDSQAAGDNTETIPTPTAADPTGPAVPAQSITLPLTVCVYAPVIYANYTAPVYTSTAIYTYTIIHTYPHDPNAFTQGLIFEDGVLYEGTGLRGRSSLRRVELETGEVLQIYELPNQYFGEGVTIYDDRIIQLTWQSNVGFVYDKDSFELLHTFDYPTEGWGITHDGEHLIMSDGTSTLYFWDPETFEVVNQIEVYDDDGPVVRLNELEYIQGEVYANVWQTDKIARIDPQTGHVVGWINLQGLLSQKDLPQTVDVLNGIAYDAAGDRLFVTGKLWPKLFEIELVPAGTLEIPGR